MNNRLKELIKFCIVGGVNAIVDIGILNLLSFITGIYSGALIVVLNAASFSVAVTNSYFLNRRWTFNHKQAPGAAEFSKYVSIYVIGAVINTSIVFLITNFIPSPDVLGQEIWLNVAKIIAIFPSFLWNFIAVKRIIFMKVPAETQESL